MDTREFYLLISSKLDTLLCLCHPNSFASAARVNYTHMQPSLIFGTHKFSLQTQEVPSGSGEPQKSALADSLTTYIFFLENNEVKECQFMPSIGFQQGILLLRSYHKMEWDVEIGWVCDWLKDHSLKV